jgi:hypothetical protein
MFRKDRDAHENHVEETKANEAGKGHHDGGGIFHATTGTLPCTQVQNGWQYKSHKTQANPTCKGHHRWIHATRGPNHTNNHRQHSPQPQTTPIVTATARILLLDHIWHIFILRHYHKLVLILIMGSRSSRYPLFLSRYQHHRAVFTIHCPKGMMMWILLSMVLLYYGS